MKKGYRNLKRKLSLIMVFALLLNSLPIFSYADSSSETPYIFNDDFSGYQSGSDGSPNWITEYISWKTEDGYFKNDLKNKSFAQLNSPTGTNMTFEAEVTVVNSVYNTANIWKMGGISVFIDGANYWHLILGESPESQNKKHYVGFAETYKGKWMAHTSGDTSLKLGTSFGGNFVWEYNHPYLLRIDLNSTSITGFVYELDGTLRWKKEYLFTSVDCVNKGFPALITEAYNTKFDNIKVSINEFAEPSNPDENSEVKIEIDPKKTLNSINMGVYGTNHRFNMHGNGMWNPNAMDAYPKFNMAYDNIGFTTMRYPGGTVGNLFKWKRSIGPLEKRQNCYSSLNGMPTGTDFGVDEAARFCEAHNSTLVYMYGMAAGNAQDAADLIEYLNSPNNGSNPNGGTDWAAVRASNGHPEPYKIKYFEIGNEMHDNNQRYWLEGESMHTYQYNYIFGGTVRFSKQPVVIYDDYSGKAAISNGKAGEVKYVKYPPVNPGTAEIFVGDTKWVRVDSLDSHGDETVYTLEETTGEIRFGDGIHGKIPEKGREIRVTYSSTHDGFNDYLKAMKSVDPTIKVYSCLYDSEFFKLMNSTYPYDGVIVHSYVNLPKSIAPSALNNYVMGGAFNKKDMVEKILKELKSSVGVNRVQEVNIAITEYGILINNEPPVDKYFESLDSGLYTGHMLMNWIELGIPHAERHCTIGSEAGIIGPAPDFIETPSARVLKMFINMFGNTLVYSNIYNAPSVKASNRETIPLIRTVASKDDAGNIYIMVINSGSEKDITASVNISNNDFTGDALVWTLNGESTNAYNTPSNPDNVKIMESIIPKLSGSFTYTFPAHSLTAIKLGNNNANKPDNGDQKGNDKDDFSPPSDHSGNSDNKSDQDSGTNTGNKNKIEFTDIDSHWSKEYIKTLAEKGIINGVKQANGEYKFYPENSITREEFAKLLAVYLELSTEDTSIPDFKDSNEIQEWSKPYIASMCKAGIIKGIEDSKGNLYFAPRSNITRQEIAAMIGRAVNYKAEEGMKFDDTNQVSPWALQYVNGLSKLNIMSGYGNNKFLPLRNASRGEVAKIIVKLIEARSQGSL